MIKRKSKLLLRKDWYQKDLVKLDNERVSIEAKIAEIDAILKDLKDD